MRAVPLLFVSPLAGALFAGGLLLVVHYFGAREVRPLGRAAGEEFGAGFATAQALAVEARKLVPGLGRA